MLTRFFRHRAIKSYLRRLLFLLRRDYGTNDVDVSYTADQIIDSLHRHRLSSRFECYAVAMFVNEEAYETARARRGWVNSYSGVRAEIASLIPKMDRAPAPAINTWVYMTAGESSAHGCHSHHDQNCDHGGN
ncbi:hypothetical protein SAMN05443245_6953 [Paraburkholderia fungorum]|uniref:Uncharacterized protein n=1 Tax=Paraburkholderia fungorum TaxID=134537 RepID=A0A1H1JND9_9BURK|nr:hypothetical protein SAMN05443245_6953 [Paraburkholderia fungorum]